MMKMGVFFIVQNMVIGQYGNIVIFLCVQIIDLCQLVVNVDLKSGLIELVFQFVEDWIVQIVGQCFEWCVVY